MGIENAPIGLWRTSVQEGIEEISFFRARIFWCVCRKDKPDFKNHRKSDYYWNSSLYYLRT